MPKAWTWLMGMLLLTGSFTLQAAPKKYPEVNQEVRSKAATEALQKEPGIALLYVKGLCCPSCAIGVRSKLSKLKFVDKKRFKKGIEMNAETQLVTVALKKDKAIDPAQVEKGIDDAGYVAIEWYTLEGATLKAHPFPNQKP
jgi:copper chaperone CopZ